MSFRFPRKLPKAWIEQNGRVGSEIHDFKRVGEDKGLDPNFGYETKGGSTQSVTANRITGWRATCPEAGTAQSITWYIKTSAVGYKCKFALYKVSNNALVAYTEEWTTSSFDDWKTLNVVWGGTLEATDYWIILWTTASDFTIYRTSHTYSWQYQDLTYNSFPDPWSPTNTYTNRKFSSYCSYTTGGAILKEVTDSLGLSDAVLRNKTLLPITDSIGLTDAILRDKTLTIVDFVGTVDSVLGDKSPLIVADSVSLADLVDVITGAIIKTVLDSVGLADQALINKSVAIADSVNFADSIIVNKVLQVTEVVNLVETIQVGVGGAKKTKLFLILGDLAVQLAGE